jgi:hypothetical protein
MTQKSVNNFFKMTLNIYRLYQIPIDKIDKM